MDENVNFIKDKISITKEELNLENLEQLILKSENLTSSFKYYICLNLLFLKNQILRWWNF